MKKVFTAIAALTVACIIHAQSMDTVFFRNLSLKYETWCWLRGSITPSDSTQRKNFKKIKTAIMAAGNPSNNTQINIDSIHGSLVILFYATFRNASQGETDFLGNELKTKISAYVPLAATIAILDAIKQSEFQNKRKNGKDEFDN
jgi:hypothetical protein